MSRKKSKQAVPEEVLAEGSGPVEVVAAEPAAEPAKKKPRKGKKAEASSSDQAEASSDEVSEAAAADGEPSDELSAPDADELLVTGESSVSMDELSMTDESADQLHETGELAATDADSMAAANSDELRDAEALVVGDDVVGAPITDDAGVEAALLPGALSAVQLRHLIEALIFATDKPVTLQRLRQLTRVSDVARIEAALAELQEDYKDRGIALQQVSGGYQFRTNTAFSSWVQQLIAGRPVRLSRAQLETLAIVANRQPITRPEIDEIRGVDSSNTLRLLLERSLIRVLGKREEVGRPTLYGTTKEFLDFFSLGDLRELPTLREYSELTAESRQVMSDRLGVPLDENGELEPEPSDEIDPDLAPDSVSIVDSILAEHAAAEAEAEARFDASAIAEAAMSGGNAFGGIERSDDLDDDAMSLSGEMATFGSKLPASEARSYVDAIRASAVTETDEDELPVADELSRDPDSSDESISAVSAVEELAAEAPHVETDLEPMSVLEAPQVETDHESMSAVDVPHVETDHDSTDLEPMTAAEAPHVETDLEPMSAMEVDSDMPDDADSDHVEAQSVIAADTLEDLDSMSGADEARPDIDDPESTGN